MCVEEKKQEGKKKKRKRNLSYVSGTIVWDSLGFELKERDGSRASTSHEQGGRRN